MFLGNVQKSGEKKNKFATICHQICHHLRSFGEIAVLWSLKHQKSEKCPKAVWQLSNSCRRSLASCPTVIWPFLFCIRIENSMCCAQTAAPEGKNAKRM